MRKISASKLNSYAFCPRRYYFRYVEGIKEPPNELMCRGLVVHELIANIINGEQSNLDEIVKKYFDVYPPPETIEHILKTVKRVREEILDKTKFQGAEIRFEKELEGFIFVGIIDAITESGQIIDWKAVDKVKIHRDPMQLSVYDRGFSSPHDVREFMFVQVTPEELVTVSYTPAEINSGWLKVLSLLPKIEKEQYPMSRTSYCERCFYSDMCKKGVKK